jgi:hypothetical protein
MITEPSVPFTANQVGKIKALLAGPPGLFGLCGAPGTGKLSLLRQAALPGNVAVCDLEMCVNMANLRHFANKLGRRLDGTVIWAIKPAELIDRTALGKLEEWDWAAQGVHVFVIGCDLRGVTNVVYHNPSDYHMRQVKAAYWDIRSDWPAVQIEGLRGDLRQLRMRMNYPASGSDDRQTHADTDARAILLGNRLALGHYNLAKLECNVLHELPKRSHAVETAAVETAAGFYDLLTATDAIFTSQRPADDAEEHWTSMSMDELGDLGLGGLSALTAAMRECLALAKPLHMQRRKLQLVSQEVLKPKRPTQLLAEQLHQLRSSHAKHNKEQHALHGNGVAKPASEEPVAKRAKTHTPEGGNSEASQEASVTPALASQLACRKQSLLAGMREFEDHWKHMQAFAAFDLWNSLNEMTTRLEGRDDKVDLVLFLKAFIGPTHKTDAEMKALELERCLQEDTPEGGISEAGNELKEQADGMNLAGPQDEQLQPSGAEGGSKPEQDKQLQPGGTEEGGSEPEQDKQLQSGGAEEAGGEPKELPQAGQAESEEAGQEPLLAGQQTESDEEARDLKSVKL